MSEADIHFELYRHLQNAIEENPNREGITYGTARPEYSEGISGRADIVVFDNNDDPVFVVEAKRPEDGGSRDIDPYAPAVIRQAFRYAGDLGSPFFCTYNRDRLVIFDAFTEGVPLLERSTKSYTISDVREFADTLLDEVARLRVGDAKWDALDAAFIDRMNSLHEYVSPRLQESLTEHLEDDKDFSDSFTAWTATQGIEYKDMDTSDQQEVRREFAEQAAYLLINKILFYKILENAPTYEDDVDPLAVSPLRVQEDLEDYFQQLVETVDFEAIYDHDPIYSEIPLDPVDEKIREFIIELDERDLTQFDSDVIGQIYEGVIPPERRREMGEYYTPPAITDLITRLTVTDASDTVLDPACGSGGFLVSAYHRIRDQLPQPAGSHDRILSQLSGVEINRFPAHLTAINLAIQDLSSYTDEVDIEINDFFNVARNQRFGRVVAGTGGEEWENGDEVTEQIGGFDAVVANPPYIRQENIDDKDHVRDHIDSLEIDAEYISRRADIYAYFLTHGTEFLAEEGDLGFITSDRWMDSKYGEDIQEFILENYEIRAIIKFDRQVFDDALVDSSVLVLRKQSERDDRDSNVAKFIRVKEEMDIEEITSIVEDDYEPNQMISQDEYRVVTRKQSALHHEPKWSVFFFAPPLYFELKAKPEIVNLSDIADVSYGIKTGANPFFTGHTQDMVDLGLESYISPLLKATGQVDKVVFTEKESDEWAVLDVHDLVESALEESEGDFGASDEDQVKDWLAENGHDALLEYVHSGELEEYHERSSLSSKDVWFDLGDITPPPMFHTQFTWREHRVVWNEAEAMATNQFHCIRSPDVDSKLLCALLNTRLVWLTKELTSRRTGGQGMTRLQTMVYETKQLPVFDPEELAAESRGEILDAFDALLAKEKELDDPQPGDKEKERDQLDRAVLSVLDMEDSLGELKEAVENLVQSREMAAGLHTSVLVERMRQASERGEPIELPGVAEARESTTLDDF
ncbi:N-6 DNA methylase [Halorubrum tebenquichense]|uniref:N-6 DNA methylase n=1 Tax=Halorubrum tebenquichense TaxID=119434 RepID=UPI0009E58DF6|nr:N-6 DNA methylase [Halorubrum tebenquichense]